MTAILKKLHLRVVIRRYEVIILGSVLLLSGAVMPSSWEPPMRPPDYWRGSPLQGLTPRGGPLAVPQINPPPQHPWIALTFDDGPHSGKTEELLAVLRRCRVPATFFVVGKMADRYPRLIRDIAREGHELANHTYTHPNLSRLSNEAILSELERTREVIQRFSGQNTRLFRPPGGDFSRRMLRLTSQAGYRIVLWNVLARDVDGLSRRAMEDRILKGAEDGAIILMHSGMKNTTEMLPGVIAQLRERGYHFVTVSTLLGLSPAPSETPAVQTASLRKY